MKDDYFFKGGFISNLNFPNVNISNNPVIQTNNAYSDQYHDLMKQEGNHSDVHTQYVYKFVQTTNIIFACGILGVLLFRKI